MNIRKGHKATFESKIMFSQADILKADMDIIEMGKGLDVGLDDIQVGGDKTLIYKGKNVVVYIRDQYSYDTQYKYHISWCSTMEKMRDTGRLNRYVISRRIDGTFVVNMMDKGSHKMIEENRIASLGVCKNCLKLLDYNGYSTAYWEKKSIIYDQFKLSEFFNKYDSKFRQLPKYYDSNGPINQYPSNWDKISREYRQFKKWICEKCGQNFSH